MVGRGIDVNGEFQIIRHRVRESVTNSVSEGTVFSISIWDMIDSADGHEAASGASDEDFAGGADEVCGEECVRFEGMESEGSGEVDDEVSCEPDESVGRGGIGERGDAIDRFGDEDVIGGGFSDVTIIGEHDRFESARGAGFEEGQNVIEVIVCFCVRVEVMEVIATDISSEGDVDAISIITLRVERDGGCDDVEGGGDTFEGCDA